ncbi:MAG TPA: hypothetical protein PLQ36_01130 [Candidatus Gracilibacteria bacterium]|nr:hypothetical protein [Candidatus Gracilibacteria bacterium]
MNDGKKSSKLDKLLLGVVIGGAVGSVVGATLSNKDNRRKVMEKAQETSNAVKKIIDNQNKNQKSFWNRLKKAIFKRK